MSTYTVLETEALERLCEAIKASYSVSDALNDDSIATDSTFSSKHITELLAEIEESITEVSEKVNNVNGEGLSSNDFTDALKTKLDGIEDGAEKNQNSFGKVVVGSTTISADTKVDTLTLVAGDNVTLTPDSTNDKITIGVSSNVQTKLDTLTDNMEHCYRLDNAERIPNGTDIHTLTDFKIYYCGNAEHAATLTNAPVTTAGFSYRYEKVNGSTGAYGIATVITTGGTEYRAVRMDNEWGDWIKTPINSNLDGNTVLISNSNGFIKSSTVTTTELNRLSGVTSNVQTQLNEKQSKITGAATSIASSDLTASRALVSNSSGKIAVSSVTSTEFGRLSGITSNVQNQIDSFKPVIVNATETLEVVTENASAHMSKIVVYPYEKKVEFRARFTKAFASSGDAIVTYNLGKMKDYVPSITQALDAYAPIANKEAWIVGAGINDEGYIFIMIKGATNPTYIYINGSYFYG